MPGVAFHARKDGGGIPEMITVLIGKNTWIRAGDILVPTNVDTRTQATNLPLVARPHYSDDTVYSGGNYGIYGVALYSIRTDSSGSVISCGAADGVVTLKGPTVMYPNPSVEYSQYDETTGYAKVAIARWCSKNLFRLKVASDDTLSESNLHVQYGLLASTTRTIADPTAVSYTINTDDTTNPQMVLRDFTPRDAVSIATAGGNYGIVEPLDSFDYLICGNAQTN